MTWTVPTRRGESARADVQDDCFSRRAADRDFDLLCPRVSRKRADLGRSGLAAGVQEYCALSLLVRASLGSIVPRVVVKITAGRL